MLPPRDGAWRSVAPGFSEWRALARSGLPFQIVAERRYDRSGDPRRLGPALSAGKTAFFPQIHQVLPRLMRLMVALRAELLGPSREECSFLFLADGQGREGMGLHHDGEVDAFWLQLEGRRTITIGPPVSGRAPQDLPESEMARRPGDWRTLELGPGTLFYMPASHPASGRLLRALLRPVAHVGATAVVSPPTGWPRARGLGRGLGKGRPHPAPSRRRLWAQLPAVAGPLDPRRTGLPAVAPRRS